MTRALGLILGLGLATSAIAQDASGLWRTESNGEGYLEVRVAPCGSAMCGVIERARSNAGAVAEFEHVGKRMLWDMTPDGAGKWSGGKIWDPTNDRTFNSRMQVSGGDLKVSGCVLGICQAQTWSRVQ
jgi:uncharacterized protein (DUF2147 family)